MRYTGFVQLHLGEPRAEALRYISAARLLAGRLIAQSNMDGWQGYRAVTRALPDGTIIRAIVGAGEPILYIYPLVPGIDVDKVLDKQTYCLTGLFVQMSPEGRLTKKEAEESDLDQDFFVRLDGVRITDRYLDVLDEGRFVQRQNAGRWLGPTQLDRPEVGRTWNFEHQYGRHAVYQRMRSSSLQVPKYDVDTNTLGLSNRVIGGYQSNCGISSQDAAMWVAAHEDEDYPRIYVHHDFIALAEAGFSSTSNQNIRFRFSVSPNRDLEPVDEDTKEPLFFDLDINLSEISEDDDFWAGSRDSWFISDVSAYGDKVLVGWYTNSFLRPEYTGRPLLRIGAIYSVEFDFSSFPNEVTYFVNKEIGPQDQTQDIVSSGQARHWVVEPIYSGVENTPRTLKLDFNVEPYEIADPNPANRPFSPGDYTGGPLRVLVSVARHNFSSTTTEDTCLGAFFSKDEDTLDDVKLVRIEQIVEFTETTSLPTIESSGEAIIFQGDSDADPVENPDLVSSDVEVVVGSVSATTEKIITNKLHVGDSVYEWGFKEEMTNSRSGYNLTIEPTEVYQGGDIFDDPLIVGRFYRAERTVFNQSLIEELDTNDIGMLEDITQFNRTRNITNSASFTGTELNPVSGPFWRARASWVSHDVQGSYDHADLITIAASFSAVPTSYSATQYHYWTGDVGCTLLGDERICVFAVEPAGVFSGVQVQSFFGDDANTPLCDKLGLSDVFFDGRVKELGVDNDDGARLINIPLPPKPGNWYDIDEIYDYIERIPNVLTYNPVTDQLACGFDRCACWAGIWATDWETMVYEGHTPYPYKALLTDPAYITLEDIPNESQKW